MHQVQAKFHSKLTVERCLKLNLTSVTDKRRDKKSLMFVY